MESKIVFDVYKVGRRRRGRQSVERNWEGSGTLWGKHKRSVLCGVGKLKRDTGEQQEISRKRVVFCTSGQMRSTID